MLRYEIIVYFYLSPSYTFFIFFLRFLLFFLYYSLQLNTFQWVLLRFSLRASALSGEFFLKEKTFRRKATPRTITVCVFQSLTELRIIDT